MRDFTTAKLYRRRFHRRRDRGANVRQRLLFYPEMYSRWRSSTPRPATSAADLSGIELSYNNLTGGNFVGQNLTNANFRGATLTDADFTGAEVRGANFDVTTIGTGITLAQLYSTASYQAHDLSAIRLDYNNLTGGNFAGQNLTNASFDVATLTDADFTDAQVQGTNFAATSRQWLHGGPTLLDGQLPSPRFDGRSVFGSNDLSGWNFAGQNLTNANFSRTTLSGADFTGAEVRGADLGWI